MIPSSVAHREMLRLEEWMDAEIGDNQVAGGEGDFWWLVAQDMLVGWHEAFKDAP